MFGWVHTLRQFAQTGLHKLISLSAQISGHKRIYGQLMIKIFKNACVRFAPTHKHPFTRTNLCTNLKQNFLLDQSLHKHDVLLEQASNIRLHAALCWRNTFVHTYLRKLFKR